MFSFSEPGYFALFLGFPILLWARFFWKGRGGRILFPYRIWGGDGFGLSRNWVLAVVILTRSMIWIGTSVLIVALAGPEITEREEINLSRGIDIMIVLDQSPSMGAQDFPPENRFDTARNMIRRFVAARKGDSLGLVSFGSDAVLRCPPTGDYDWLVSRLNELKVSDLGDDTAIGMGLALAVLHLADSSAEEKVILLLTDGDDNAGEIRPDMAATLAVDHDIRIYSIGIGSEGESAIELINPDTGLVTRGFIVTKFNEDSLRTIAKATGGEYWRATSPGALETVFQEVDALETVERQVSVRVSSRLIHRPFVLVGACMIMLSYLIRKLLMGEIP